MRFRLCNKDDVPANGMKSFTIEGEPILVACIDGEFLAISDTCSHSGLSLSEGKLEDHTIQCPHHGGVFDLTNGEALSLPAIAPVEHYDLVIEGDDIFLDL
jgi:nitrite reductase/ring-hydroxylating ferredoxin subunit